MRWELVLLLIPLIYLFQIALPSSLMPSFDLGFGDSTTRSFPENLGSGSIPETPKVVPYVAHVHWVLCTACGMHCNA